MTYLISNKIRVRHGRVREFAYIVQITNLIKLVINGPDPSFEQRYIYTKNVGNKSVANSLFSIFKISVSVKILIYKFVKIFMDI